MNGILVTALVGIVVGIIDIAPMIKMKLDRYAISSAFAFYFIMPFIIYNLKLLENVWWLKGGLITLILSIPITILVAKGDKKSCIPITIMAIVLGTVIGIVGHFLALM
ncbi:MAG: hypothetical protein LBV40_03710 [Methanomicrobiales archaeon]|jgi:hypothetical protein|nr:hypothetical protein [Methanomicrobiales archaeon]